MRWDIVWSFPAEWMLKAIPFRQAERVDASVQRFARTGIGNIERMGESLRHLRLHVPPFVLHLELDPESEILRVWSIRRRGSEAPPEQG
jgi:hypothetical protein